MICGLLIGKLNFEIWTLNVGCVDLFVLFQIVDFFVYRILNVWCYKYWVKALNIASWILNMWRKWKKYYFKIS